MNNNQLLGEEMKNGAGSALQAMLGSSRFGFMCQDAGTGTIIASQTIYHLLQISLSERLTAGRWRSFIHPDDLDQFVSAEEALLRDGRERAVEYRLMPLSGGPVWVSHVMQRSESQGPAISITSVLEKGEREMIREQETQWKSLVENAAAVVTRWNRELKLVYANSAFEKKTGSRNESMYGRTRAEMGHPPEVAGPFMARLQEVFETGEAVGHFGTFPTPAGIASYFTRIVPEKDAAGTVQTVMSIGTDITELRKAEQELEENRAFLQEVTSTVPDYIALHEAGTGNLIYANRDDFWEEYNLDPRKKNLFTCAEQIVHPEELDNVKRYLAEREALERDEIAEIELRTRLNRWIRFRSKVFRQDARGRQAEILSVITDVTTRKKAELELTESKQLLQSIFDTTLVGMSLFAAERDEKGFILDFRMELVNKNIERFTNRKDLVGKRYSEEFPGIRETGLYSLMLQVMQTGEPGQMDYHYTHEGFNNWFSSMFVKIYDGLIATTVDISARKRAEEEQLKNFILLQQSEALAGSGSWEYNTYTRTMLWSDGMYHLFGLGNNLVVTPSIYLLFVVPDDRTLARQLVKGIEQDFVPLDLTLRIAVNGTVKTLRIKAHPSGTREGDLNRMLGIDLDITLEKRSEERIQQLNKTLMHSNRQLASLNSQLTTFQSIAAHDYLETLHHLYITLEFIVSKEARHLTDAGKAHVRRAQRAIQKMKLLTDDIVSFLKLHTLDAASTPVNLNDSVHTVLTDLQERIDHANVRIRQEALPTLEGYPLLLALLLHHLLDNALKFMKKEGEHLIHIRYESLEKTHYNGEETQTIRYHKISVSDNGIGFDPKEAEKVFTIFYRLHEKDQYRGAGVGLAVCRKIMDLHNGYITAESQPLAGTTISCYFPQ